MKKRTVFITLAVLCVIASLVMWSFRNDSHLSELGDFFWMPLPLMVIFFYKAAKLK
jgi:hypothetical protein